MATWVATPVVLDGKTGPTGPAGTGSGSGSGNIMVASGYGSTGGILRSADGGVTWSYAGITGAVANIVTAVAYNGLLWVVSDDTHGIVYSEDGLTWANTGNVFLSAGFIKWNGRQFLTTYTQTGTDLVHIPRSVNGTVWYNNEIAGVTGYTDPIDSTYYPPSVADAASDGSRWVAVLGGRSENGYPLITSVDNGVTWNDIGITGASGFFDYGNGISYSNGLWVAVGGSSSNAALSIMNSVDGLSWFPSGGETGNTGNFGHSGGFGSYVASNGIQWVAVGGGQTGVSPILTSLDGYTWSSAGVTGALNDTPAEFFNSVKWSGRYWVAIGTVPNTIVYSDDGLTWTNVSGPVFDIYGSEVASNYVLDIVRGSGGAGGGDNGSSVSVFAPYGFTVAGGSGPTGGGYGLNYSLDGGQTWYFNKVTGYVGTDIYYLTYGTSFVGCDNFYGVNSSVDGYAWRGSYIYAFAKVVAWTGNEYIAYSYGSHFAPNEPTIFRSANAIEWSGVTGFGITGGTYNGNPTDPIINGFASDGSRIVAVLGGQSSNLGYPFLTSTDNGSTWTDVGFTGASGFFDYGKDIVYDNGMWVAVGASTTETSLTIMKSSDGLVWSGVGGNTGFGLTGEGRAVGFNGVEWVAVGGGTGAQTSLVSLPAATSWRAEGAPGGGNGLTNARDVVWNGYYWVAVGDDRPISFSTDGGLNWNPAQGSNLVSGNSLATSFVRKSVGGKGDQGDQGVRGTVIFYGYGVPYGISGYVGPTGPTGYGPTGPGINPQKSGDFYLNFEDGRLYLTP